MTTAVAIKDSFAGMAPWGNWMAGVDALAFLGAVGSLTAGLRHRRSAAWLAAAAVASVLLALVIGTIGMERARAAMTAVMTPSMDPGRLVDALASSINM